MEPNPSRPARNPFRIGGIVTGAYFTDRAGDLSDGYPVELEQEIAQPNQSLNQHAWRFREGLEERIAETRERIAVLRAEFRAHR